MENIEVIMCSQLPANCLVENISVARKMWDIFLSRSFGMRQADEKSSTVIDTMIFDVWAVTADTARW